MKRFVMQHLKEFCLAGGLILFAFIWLTVQSLFFSGPAIRAEVSVDGTVVKVFDLAEDQEFTVNGADGGFNRLIVRDGEVWCQEASCPDKVCIQQGKQKNAGSSIVCLPNRMIVTIIGE